MDKLEDLVVRARTGDHGAYGIIFQRFKAMAFAYAYSVLGDYELAEDARQEAFIDAYCDLLALRRPAAFPGWFRRIVHSHSLRFGKGRRALTVPLERIAEQTAPGPGPAGLAQGREIMERVVDAIDHLPAHEREVTELYYLDELSQREIGARLGIPAKTVKSRLFSARARLRRRLMEMVKETVREQHHSGDRRPRRSATLSAIQQLDEELDALRRPPSEVEQRRVGELLCAKGRLQRFAGETDQALETFESGSQIPLHQADSVFRARIGAELGLTYVQRADYARAKRHLRSSRRIMGRLKKSSTLQASILNCLGMCAWGEGQFGAARKFYRESAEMSRRVRCGELAAVASNNLALLEWKAGRIEAALAAFRACLKRWKKSENRFGWALTMMNVGVAEENLGRFAVARRHYAEALAVAEEIGFIQLQAATHTNVGNLALGDEQWKEALRCNRRALELAREAGDRRAQGIALENIALAHIGLGRDAEVRRFLRDARRTARAINDQERLFSLELVEIEARVARKRPLGLLDRLADALKTLRRKGYTAELPRLLRLRAEAELITNKKSKARRTINEALRECRKQKNRAEERKIARLNEHLGD